MSQPLILCCGEALVDMIPGQTADGAACYVPHAGGAVFNTALALGRLGAPTGFLSGVSRDAFGRLLEGTLAEASVNLSRIVRADRPATLAFVELTDGKASYAFYDEGTAGRMLALSDLAPLGPEVGALFFGGISLVVEPAAATYQALMAREGAARPVMVDPNIRPGFIAPGAAEARYRARLSGMIAAADMLKLSDEDLHWLLGPGDTLTLARSLLAPEAAGQGPRIVFVTEGEKGATAVTRRGDRHRRAERVTVADTVGAGDTFNAGVLAALSAAGALTREGLARVGDGLLDQALDLAVRAAAITVSRPGANPPWQRELAL
jgi:fructokinase